MSRTCQKCARRAELVAGKECPACWRDGGPGRARMGGACVISSAVVAWNGKVVVRLGSAEIALSNSVGLLDERVPDNEIWFYRDDGTVGAKLVVCP